MFHRHKALLSLAVVLGLCLALAGCSGKITKANAEKISTGMTEDEVKAILGEPTTTADTDKAPAGKETGKAEKTGIKQVTWKSGTQTISISFKDGKVAAAPVTGGM